MPRFLPAAALLPLLLAACGEAPAPVAEEPAGPAGPPPLSGPQFAAEVEANLGRTVAVAVCSLDPNPDTLGYMECRLRDAAGADVTDAAGQPIDLFIPARDLSDVARAFVTATCGRDICLVSVAGRLERAENGNFLVMRETVITAPQ